jgi:quercetin dioxygenase-like cupin family protein
MFRKSDANGYEKIQEGIRIKTLVFGEKTSMTEFRLKKGTEVPVHQHPHEQTGYLVSGGLNFIIAGECLMAKPGDSWNIPGGVEHGAEALEDTVVIEVFSPVREEYLREE